MDHRFESLADTRGKAYIHIRNFTDKDNNPAGGLAFMQRNITSNYVDDVTNYYPFNIMWQDGPLDREAGEVPNGSFVEDILEVCRIRLEFYQDSPFACDENANAIKNIKSAIYWLDRRRSDRKARGVQGKNEE